LTSGTTGAGFCKLAFSFVYFHLHLYWSIPTVTQQQYPQEQWEQPASLNKPVGRSSMARARSLCSYTPCIWVLQCRLNMSLRFPLHGAYACLTHKSADFGTLFANRKNEKRAGKRWPRPSSTTTTCGCGPQQTQNESPVSGAALGCFPHGGCGCIMRLCT
jgi:hypothetical protein